MRTISPARILWAIAATCFLTAGIFMLSDEVDVAGWIVPIPFIAAVIYAYLAFRPSDA